MQNSDIDGIVTEWGRIATRPSRRSNKLLKAEFSALDSDLRRLNLQEFLRQPSSTLGSIGDAIVWLTDEEFVWLLPLLLFRACQLDEPVYATAVVNRMIKTPTLPGLGMLSHSSSAGIELLIRKCCQIGWWHDQDRAVKREKLACSILEERTDGKRPSM